MKNKITLLVLLVAYAAISQGGATNFDKQLQFSPVSPEAGSLGNFKNFAPSTLTGRMQFSVPVYTIPVGQYSWPISLEYGYGGLILEGKPSMTGLGWFLSGNGTVVREVRGNPDDVPYGYYDTTRKIKQKIDTYLQSGDISLEDFRNFRDGKYDSQVDKYNVSVGNVRFSFKLDQYNNPIYLSDHNNKVSFSDEMISVIDDAGIIYEFSDVEKNDTTDESPFTLQEHTTAWNLTRILYPNGRSIRFQYADDRYESYDFNAYGAYATNYVGPGEIPPGTRGTYEHTMSKTNINRKLLFRILFDQGAVTFTIGEKEGRKLYTNIVVKNNKGQTIHHYDLSYEGPRDVLTQITDRGEDYYGFEYHNTTMPEFFLSKTRFPVNQDNWGFYNGQSNEFALNIPNSRFDADKAPNFYSTLKGAMKKITYPTGGYATINYEQNEIRGYPGENNPDIHLNRQIVVRLQSKRDLDEPMEKGVSFSYTFDRPTIARISSTMRGTRDNTRLQLRITRNDLCPLSSANLVSDDYYTNAAHLREVTNDGSNVYIPRMCPTLGDDYEVDGGDPSEYIDQTQTSGGRIIIEPGTYRFSVRNRLHRLSDAFGQIKVQFHQPVSDAPISRKVGGIRVASIETYDPQTAKTTKKYFDYDDAQGVSSGYLVQNKVEATRFNITASCSFDNPDDKPPHIYAFFQDVYSIKRYSTLDEAQGYPVYYEWVKEAEEFIKEEVPIDDSGDLTGGFNPDGFPILTSLRNAKKIIKHYPKGYTWTHYIPHRPSSKADFILYPKDRDLSESRIWEEGVVQYDTARDTVKPVSHTIYAYKEVGKPTDQQPPYIRDNYPWSFKISLSEDIHSDCDSPGSELYPNTVLGEQMIIGDHTVQRYRERHKRYIQEVKGTKEYFYDGTTPTITTQRVESAYNDRNYLKETRSANSNGEVFITRYAYPDDVTTVSSLQGGDLLQQDYNVIDRLKAPNKHRIATPIQVANYKKKGNEETLLSTERNLYRYGPANTTIIAKKALQTLKGIPSSINILEPRVTFHQHDNHGNPLEVSKADGSHIVYIWGYQDQYPIAKIDNATYDQVAGFVSNLKTQSNADNDRTTGNIGKEGALRQSLNALREALPNALVTTYTYDPLVGITSMTDPTGYTTYYRYDHLNRLDYTADANNKVLQKYNYNYEGDKGGSFDEITTTFTTPPALTGVAVTITANSTGGSGSFLYEWKIDGHIVPGTASSISHTFATPGDKTIHCKVVDKATGAFKSFSGSIRAYPPLTTPSITPEHAAAGISTRFKVLNVGGGSGKRTYEWYVDSVKLLANGGSINQSFDAGAHIIKFIVKDDIIPGHFAEVSKTIQVHQPLTNPRVDAVVNNYVVKGTKIDLVTSNIGGGSGHKTYEWYLKGVKQSATGTSFSYTPVATGNYHVKFKVIDTRIPDHYKEGNITLYAYNPFVLKSITATKTKALTGVPIDFNVSRSGGSDKYLYEWKINGGAPVSNYYTLQKSFSTKGTYNVSCTVRDARTDQAPITKSVNVTIYKPLNTPKIHLPSLNNGEPGHYLAGRTVNMNAQNIGEGSGHRRYEWYFNGVKQSATGTSFSKHFGSKGTYTIKFRVIDTQLANHFKEVTRKVYIHNRMVINGPYATTSETITRGQSVRFEIDAGRGSGSYVYSWSMDGPIGPGTGGTNRTTYSYGPNETGSYTFHCRARDTKTGVELENSVTSYITVRPEGGGSGGGGGDTDPPVDEY